MSDKPIPKIIEEISLNELNKIDVALEGDWSSTVVTIWTCEKGFQGFSEVARSHERFKPSLELYFDGMWVGLHCFNRVDNENVFDEQLAMKVVEYVDQHCRE